MAKPVKISSLAKFSILMLLNKGSVHGYDLLHGVSQISGAKIGPGHVYPFLKEMKGEGLITITQFGDREKKTYKLTLKGRAFVREQLNSLAGMLDLALSSRITECAHCECKIASGGVSAKRHGRQFIFCCNACEAAYFSKKKIK